MKIPHPSRHQRRMGHSGKTAASAAHRERASARNDHSLATKLPFVEDHDVAWTFSPFAFLPVKVTVRLFPSLETTTFAVCITAPPFFMVASK